MPLTACAVQAAAGNYVYACGPPANAEASQGGIFSDQNVNGYVSLEERMACG